MDKSKIQEFGLFFDLQKELDRLKNSSSRNLTTGYFESALLYRGQPSNTEIVATIYRNKPEGINAGREFPFNYLEKEYENICRWVSRANSIGLRFNFNIWSYLNRRHFDIPEDHAPDYLEKDNSISNHYPVLSLSRHNGCANRLIDFTKDGYAGLFFSLVSGFSEIEKAFDLHCGKDGVLDPSGERDFAEWINGRASYLWVLRQGQKKNSEILVPDYGNNPFAFAQKAVFVLAPLDITAAGVEQKHTIFSEHLAYFGFREEVIFSIPYKFIPRMLRHMEEIGLDHIKYYPSPEAISKNSNFMERVIRVHQSIKKNPHIDVKDPIKS
jgi:hypothetical protein